MRTLLILIFALTMGLSTASAQSRGVTVMHVGPAPDYRMSIGIVVVEQERLMMRARIEFAPDCAPAGVAALDVTHDQVFPMTRMNPSETPEQYGEVHVAAYNERVAAMGGVANAEYVDCVRRVMSRGQTY